MTIGGRPEMNAMSLVDVGELCADVAITSGRLFELAAMNMMGSEPGPRQRRFASASDRHAWHRELAVGRSPRIPLVAPIEAAPPSVIGEAKDWWSETASLRDRLLDAYPRLHPELDPATARLIQLVVSDLDELLQELSPTTS